MSHSLYRFADGVIPDSVLAQRNKAKSWAYGYDSFFDIVIISKDGTLGDIYEINGLLIGLPAEPKKIDKGTNRWTPKEYPKELSRIKTMLQFMKSPKEFKNEWVDYINNEYDIRETGHWFINNNRPVYITGSHYMYLQWSKIDIGLPEFRESNRIFYIFWEACKADSRCYGICYLKNRRSGFSFMSSSEADNIGTSSSNARIGMCSKTNADAKKMFTDKVVPIFRNYPFFFKPAQEGMDNPKTELAFRLPASKITKKSMHDDINEENQLEELNTSIDYKPTGDNSYDGEKLLLLIEDESGKLEKPANIKEGWRVRKTCLRLGRKIIGKCMMGTTVNALQKGGQNFKDIYLDSNPRERTGNGQTKSGLYSLFIPMEHNLEGFIDEYGYSVIDDPETTVMGIDGLPIDIGAITYWENEATAKKGDSDDLNEHYRQYPRTESHAFRDESKQSLFNVTKIYTQIDFNEEHKEKVIRGNFHWKDGKKDTTVVWSPERNGRFYLSWMPPTEMQNAQILKDGKKYPGNIESGAFGCDSYDISGTVDGSGSNGALHGLTGTSLNKDVPSNQFFLEYVARPQSAEIFFEDVLMACVFYGMPILAENNKPRLLYHFKNRGYRKYSMNRPDKVWDKLSKTEKELGGIPNSSEDIKQLHASCIETYIERYVGLDTEGTYRNPEEIGHMYFNRTLQDWKGFEIANRTKYDASISSGLAIMAVRKDTFNIKKEITKKSIKFATYNNQGEVSQRN